MTIKLFLFLSSKLSCLYMYLGNFPNKEFLWFLPSGVKDFKIRSKITKCPTDQSMYACTNKLQI